MAKVSEPLGDKRFLVVKITETSDGKKYAEPLRGGKELKPKESALSEAQRQALLGNGDIYVVEVIAGFGRRLQATELEI